MTVWAKSRSTLVMRGATPRMLLSVSHCCSRKHACIPVRLRHSIFGFVRLCIVLYVCARVSNIILIHCSTDANGCANGNAAVDAAGNANVDADVYGADATLVPSYTIITVKTGHLSTKCSSRWCKHVAVQTKTNKQTRLTDIWFIRGPWWYHAHPVTGSAAPPQRSPRGLVASYPICADVRKSDDVIGLSRNLTTLTDS